MKYRFAAVSKKDKPNSWSDYNFWYNYISRHYFQMLTKWLMDKHV